MDLVFAKRVRTGGSSSVEVRAEIFNVFNRNNFASPVTTLPQALPGSSYDPAKNVQPGQPYSSITAGTFGKITSTVGRSVGLGTNRQMQFAVRFNF